MAGNATGRKAEIKLAVQGEEIIVTRGITDPSASKNSEGGTYLGTSEVCIATRSERAPAPTSGSAEAAACATSWRRSGAATDSAGAGGRPATAFTAHQLGQA